ncbi:hypothetical protein ACM66B_005554 [Microbotryomycetes sp. NB124-2]
MFGSAKGHELEGDFASFEQPRLNVATSFNQTSSQAAGLARSCPDSSSLWLYNNSGPIGVDYDQMILEALQASEEAVSRAEAEAYMSSPNLSVSSFPTSPEMTLNGAEWPESVFTSFAAPGEPTGECLSSGISNQIDQIHHFPAYSHYSPHASSPLVDLAPQQPRAPSHDPWMQTSSSTPAFEAHYPSPPATVLHMSPHTSSSFALSSPPSGLSAPLTDLPLPLQKPTPEALKTYANTDLIGLGFTSRPPPPRGRTRKHEKPSVLSSSASSSSAYRSTPSGYSSEPPRRTRSSDGLARSLTSRHPHQRNLHTSPQSSHRPLRTVSAHHSPTIPYSTSSSWTEHRSYHSSPRATISRRHSPPSTQTSPNPGSIRFINMSASSEQDRQALSGGYETMKKLY